MGSKKIYINGRFLLQPPTGVNRFAYELCRAFTCQNIEFTIICPSKTINGEYNIENFNIIYFGFMSSSSHFWEQIVLPLFFVKKQNYILLNFTGLGPVLISKKIITIHDVAFLYNPLWYSFFYRVFYKILTPLCAGTSQKILTVSEFSKSEIIRFLNIDKDKIEIVYNAVPSVFYNETYQNNVRETEERYILAVSSIDPRKNFNTLIKAFSHLKDIPVRLFIIGGRSKIYSQATEEYNQNEKITWLGRVSDAELINYYKHALCFVYPSLYEGFGIPPLEAMLLSCPVITSDIEVFHEVYGQSVLYVDPLEDKQIADTIKLLLMSPELRKELIDKGIKHAQGYSWNNSASKVMKILYTIAS